MSNELLSKVSNRTINTEIVSHCGVYVTFIMRLPDCTESEKNLILEKGKQYFEKATKYGGEQYDLPYHSPINLGEVVFHTTFVFPNEDLRQKYENEIS